MHPAHDSADGEDESWWDQAKNAAGSVVDDAGTAAGNAWDSTKEAASDAWDTAKDTAGAVVDDVGEAAGEVWNGVKGAASTAGGIVDDAKEKVGEIVQGVQQTLNSGIDEIVQGVSEIASDVGKSIEDFAADVSAKYADEIAAVKEFLSDVKHYLQNPGDALRKLEEIIAGLKRKAGELFGDDDDAPDRYSGTLEPIEVMGAPTPCHDEAAPVVGSGKRRLKLNPSLDVGSEHKNEAPQGGLISHDSIRPTLAYESDISKNDPVIAAVPTDDFGTTGSRIRMDNLYYTIEHWTDYVTMNARLFQTISWAITERTGLRSDKSGHRINATADLSSITEDNWKAAADSLDPDLGKTKLGAPKRADAWASDITAQHEQFHVADKDKHMREVVTLHLLSDLKGKEVEVDWFFYRYENLTKDLRAIMSELAVEATAMQNAHMGEKGEHRAYAADEPKYRAQRPFARKRLTKAGSSRFTRKII